MKEHIHYFSLCPSLSLQHTILIVSLPIFSWIQGSYTVWAITASNPHVLWMRISMNMYLGNERQMVFQSVSSLSPLSTRNQLHVSTPFYSYLFPCFYLRVFTNSTSLNVFSNERLFVFCPLTTVIYFAKQPSHIDSPDFTKRKKPY